MLYRVMLADDEPIMRKALLTLTDWGQIGCQIVYTAANGQEVLEHLESVACDILITDIRMPGQDGIELARYIWENKLPVKVIILTGYADFSYAQSAVKYGVVDYVTKTGAFDSLITAVERAKEKIEEEQKNRSLSDGEAETKNLLKSVFDGSLYEAEAIKEDFEKLRIRLENYVVLLIQFRMGDEREGKGLKSVYQSLDNFFSMVFASHMVQAVPVERDMFAVVLTDMQEECGEVIRSQCGQIIDMMDNFMQLYAYIGVGGYHKEMAELKTAYNEAERALGYSFVPEAEKVHFFADYRDNEEAYPPQIEQQIEKICTEVQKGRASEAVELFQELSVMQKQFCCSEHMIKNSGILLQSRCRRVLSEYDKTIYEVTGMHESISRTIYHCRYMEEYEKLLKKIVEKTAGTVHIAVNRKDALVYECQRYIAEHYERNILVNDIAREIGASASYLSRIFKQSTGQTIIYTLNQKKLEKAKEYMQNSDLKIYEIAERLGFENATYFSHFFKKYEGVSPKDYKGD